LDIVGAAPQKLNSYGLLQTSTRIFSALLERQTRAGNTLAQTDTGFFLGAKFEFVVPLNPAQMVLATLTSVSL
jgi:hypothetical protein